MTGTQFCDSAGVHVLMGAHQQAVAGGGELLLVIPAGAGGSPMICVRKAGG